MRSFFTDLHSTLNHTGTEIGFLHFYILQRILQGSGSKLQADQLVMEMIDKVLHAVPDYRSDAAFSSGFKSIEYFTAAFRQQYQCPSARFRTTQAARFSR